MASDAYGIIEETARFTRRLARFIIDVFFVVFLRLAAVRVVLRFLVVAGFFADFLLFAMWPSSACGESCGVTIFRFFRQGYGHGVRKFPPRASGLRLIGSAPAPNKK